MAKRGFNRRWLGAVGAALVGGSVMQLGGCDPTVREALLAGLNDTTNSLLVTVSDAFFLSLQDDDEDNGGGGLTTP